MNLENLLFKFIHYWSLLLGINNHFLQMETKHISETIIYKIYTKFIYLLTIIGVPFYYFYGKSYLDVYREERPLLPILNRLNVQVQCSIVVMTAFNRWRNSQLQQDMDKLIKKVEFSKSSKYRHLCRMKFICFFAQGFSEFIAIIYFKKKKIYTVLDIFLLVYFAIVHTMLHLYLYHIFYMLWKIAITLDEMQLQLLGVLRSFNNLQKELPGLLQRLLLMDCIIVKLFAFFQFYILAWLLILYVYNSILVYIIFLMISKGSASDSIVIFSVLATIIKFVDTYLLIICCDSIAAKRLELRQILVEYIDESEEVGLGHVVDVVDKDTYIYNNFLFASFQINNFLLRTTLHKCSFNIYGLFDLKKSLALTILANAITQSIIVIQFDYILAGKWKETT